MDAPPLLKRIVVTDDNRPAADGMVRLLNALGFDARPVYSGNDLLSTLALGGTDLALIDIGMPEMDGYEVAREIRKRGYMLPIIALTGYGLPEDKEKAEKAGFTRHLTKPAGASDLRTALEELLSN